MIHEPRQEGEECNALKEMPISLWILHLIKNTAADTSIQEAESQRKRNEKKGESETESKGGGHPDVARKETLSLNWRNNFSRATKKKNNSTTQDNVYISKHISLLLVPGYELRDTWESRPVECRGASASVCLPFTAGCQPTTARSPCRVLKSQRWINY